jgi:hypothetical protein
MDPSDFSCSFEAINLATQMEITTCMDPIFFNASIEGKIEVLQRYHRASSPHTNPK